jgi:unsaturated chondroitin disaccharide hydrolase
MSLAKDRVIDYALRKIERTAGKVKGEFPHLTEGGYWKTTSDGSWTGGFWIGILWLEYLATNDEKFLKLAHEWTLLLKPRKNDKTFDLGFLFYPSFASGYKITNDENLRKVALEAADTLAGLFHVKSGFICQEILEGGRKFGRTAIDVMMNLPLLWWAYGETGEGRYYEAARMHSIKTLENLTKNNGLAIHAIDLDLKTGEIVRKLTLHGYSCDSCWSRGQAWSIYGFTLAYKATKEKVFLNTAEKLADYFIKNLPADHVPFWDFDDPDIPNAPKDSSAAAIACSAFIILSEFSYKPIFKEAWEEILSSLCKNYIAEEDKDGILKNGCFCMRSKIGVNESLSWGDFYFLESLLKVKLGKKFPSVVGGTNVG